MATILPLFLNKISAGFSSPAEDYVEKILDLNELCIQHPAATFFLRATGDSMINVGIFPNDILIVDRSLTAKEGDIVIAALLGEFTVKMISFKPYLRLVPMNANYKEIIIKEADELEIFGVVTKSIRSFRL